MPPKPAIVLGALTAGALLSPLLAPPPAAHAGLFRLPRCLPMTATRCLHPQNSCDYPAARAMYSDPDALCNHLVQDAALAAASVAGTRATLSNAGEVTQAYLHRTDPQKLSFTGLTSAFMGSVLQESVTLHQSGWWPEFINTLFGNDRATWEANGDTIASCHEYAYEKFYDYTRFEDASLPYYQTSDFRAIVAMAYGDPTENGGIGSRALGDGLRQKNRAAMPPVPFPADFKKNVFFHLPRSAESPTAIHALSPAEGEDAVDSALYFPDHLLVTLAHRHRELYLDGIVFTDPALIDTLASGQLTYKDYPTKGFAWHSVMALADNGAATDYERTLWQTARDNFAALLAERASIVSAIRALIPGDTLDELVDPREKFDPLSKVSNPEHELRATYQFDYQTAVDNGDLDPNLDALQLSVLGGGAGIGAPIGNGLPTALEALPPTLARRSAAVSLFYRLQDVDDRLEEAFRTAPAECIWGTRCDWSPRDFAQALSHHFVDERERAFKSCMDYNGGEMHTQEFAPLASFPGCANVDLPYASPRQASPNKSYVVTCGADTDHLDYCMRCFAQQFIGVKDFAGQLVDPRTHEIRLIKHDGDEAFSENPWFGADVGYRVAFEATGIELEDPAAVALYAMSKLWVKTAVLGKWFDVVDVSLGISDAPQPATVEGEVIDGALADIWLFDAPYAPQTFELGAVNVVEGVAQKLIELGHAEGQVWIGPVRVVVEGSITGSVGAIYEAQGGKTVGGASRIKAHLTPYASLDPWGPAAVHQSPAQPGIRGHLTIARVNVPLVVNAAIDTSMSGTDLDLSLDLTADVAFEVLSGSISAYVEVLWSWSDETELASWDGFRRTVPLIKIHADQVPMSLLRRSF